MTHVPASSHGSTFNGGTITAPLTTTITVPAGGSAAPSTASTTNDLDWTYRLDATDDGGGDYGLALSMQAAQHGVVTFLLSDDSGTGQLVYRSNGGLILVRRAAYTGPAYTGAGAALSPITSGALPTVAPVSATAFQCSTTRDVFLTVPVTYNPGVATTATCKVELSPDNVTFSTLLTITQPVGTVFDGSVEAVQLIVPAAWQVKLTVVNATLGTGTYY